MSLSSNQLTYSRGMRFVPGVLLPRGRFAWRYFRLGIALYIAGLLTMPWLRGLAVRVGLAPESLILLPGTLFVSIALFTPWLLSRHVYAQDYPAPSAFPAWRAMIVVVMTVLVQIVATVFESAVSGAREAGEQVAQSLGLGQGIRSDMAVVLAVTVLAPLGEELLFRGLFFRSLRDGLARSLPLQLTSFIAITLSSLLFAIVHTAAGQQTQWPVLFVIGALFALAYEWTGSLVAPMMVHALNNTLALAQVLRLPAVALSQDWIFLLIAGAPFIVWLLANMLLRHLPEMSEPIVTASISPAIAVVVPQSADPERQPDSNR